MKRELLPVSKAENAFDLLGEVQVLVGEEPKRYDQRDHLLATKV